MTWVVMFFVLLWSAIFQVLCPALTVLGQAKAPLLLAVVVYYALNRETTVMVAAAVLAGVLQDAVSPLMPLGYSSACFCGVGWFLSRFRSFVMTESASTVAFFGGLAALVVTAALHGLLAARGLVAYAPSWAGLKMAGAALLGAVCTPFVYAVVERIDRWVGNTRKRAQVHDF